MQLPPGLLHDLQGVKGFDEAAFLQAHNTPAVTSIRLHPLKTQHSKLETQNYSPVPWCPEGRYLTERPVFTLDPLIHAGAYYVQEASSMFLDFMVRQLVPDTKDFRVLDLCAAPGGKSSILASLLDSSALLISNEVIRSRASILEENVVKWGYTNNWVISNEARDIGRLEGYFDLIVVDAPCSGSGLFRKDPDALNEWSENNVELCSQRQQKILADIWPALKEDGVLIYATCSYSPKEDEDTLDWLTENFHVQSLALAPNDDWGIIETESSKGLKGYRFFPDKLKGEGFFIAAVSKKESTRTTSTARFKTAHQKKEFEQCKIFLKHEDFICLRDSEGNFNAINTNHEADHHMLSKVAYLRKTGMALGMPTAKEWIPAHEIALSLDRSTQIHAIDLDKSAALHFLKKEDLPVPSGLKSWQLITYHGLGLGWIKCLPNRFNNYLPKSWRIRMELEE